jgi:rubrerythrin
MQTETASKKPPYLGLLNAISLAETRAGVYLRAWADATNDEDLACTLRLVAARETSHGQLFCRMLSELGFELRQKPDPEGAERIAKYANPKVSDLEKIGRVRSELESDPFREIEGKIAEGYYDPVTANMLGWYICEERDSAKRLRAAYACVRVRSGDMEEAKPRSGRNGSMTQRAEGPSADAQAIMACLADGFARLEKKLDKIGTRAKA